SPSRWRWIGPVHAVLMTVIVVVTGNHWWLDGIVAVLVLVLCAWTVFGVRTGWHRLRARRTEAAPPPVEIRSRAAAASTD
ncbi:MAG TPA: phosphatase PAP2 family protein, partial [Kribbella sp.]